MGEEIAFENGRISDFQGLVTSTLDRVILHTVMRHSSTSIYIPNFIESSSSDGDTLSDDEKHIEQIKLPLCKYGMPVVCTENKWRCSQRNVLWTDGQMDVQTDIRMGKQTFEIHFIRSTQQSRPKDASNEYGTLLQHL